MNPELGPLASEYAHAIEQEVFRPEAIKEIKKASVLAMAEKLVTIEAHETNQEDHIAVFRPVVNLTVGVYNLSHQVFDAHQHLDRIADKRDEMNEVAKRYRTQVMLADLFLKINEDKKLDPKIWDHEKRWSLYREAAQLYQRVINEADTKKRIGRIEKEAKKIESPDKKLQKVWTPALVQYASMPDVLMNTADPTVKNDSTEWKAIPGLVPDWHINAVRSKTAPSLPTVSNSYLSNLQGYRNRVQRARVYQEVYIQGSESLSRLEYEAKDWVDQQIDLVFANPTNMGIAVLTTASDVLIDLGWKTDQGPAKFNSNRDTTGESYATITDSIARRLSGTANRAMIALAMVDQFNESLFDPNPKVVEHKKDQFMAALEQWVLKTAAPARYYRTYHREKIEQNYPDGAQFAKTWLGFMDRYSADRVLDVANNLIARYFYTENSLSFEQVLVGLSMELCQAYPDLSEAERRPYQQSVEGYIKGSFREHHQYLQQFLHQTLLNDVLDSEEHYPKQQQLIEETTAYASDIMENNLVYQQLLALNEKLQQVK